MTVLEEIDQIRGYLSGPGQPFELIEQDVRGAMLPVYRHVPKNLSKIVADAAAFNDRIFMVYGDQRITFAEALAKAAGLAGLLKDRYGLGKKDRVAIAMRNSPDWVIAYLAVLMNGAAAALINSRGAPDEMLFAIHDVECALLFADQRRADVLSAGYQGPLIVAEGGVFTEKGAPLDIRDAAPTVNDCTPDDPSLILFTSGTTGRPKGAVLTHLGVATFLFTLRHAGATYMAHAAKRANMQVADLMKMIPQPSTLAVFPFFHVSGASALILTQVMNGGKMVLMDRWDAGQALKLVASEKITQLTGPPSIYWDLIAHPDFATADVSSVTNVGIGGQATPPNLLTELRRTFPRAAPGGGFGMTETNGSISSAMGEEYLFNPAASGRVQPGVRVRIVDDAGREAPLGEPGEIQVKSALVTAGYWNNPDATAAAFRDGWLCTGDIGFLDENRYVTIVDRKKDMVIRAGENIYCAELERVFADYPGVLEVSAFGVPDDRLGERVVLAIHPHLGAEIDPAAVLAFGKTKLADFKIPSEVRVTAEPFERNVLGKVNKIALRQQIFG